ncbi:MAG: response regulator [Parasulfuritortus sp.]|nr:response regulator [Parasulfuritortus sp.]
MIIDFSSSVVHVVDDEAPFRRSLLFLLESSGWQSVGHASAEEFLMAAPSFPSGGGCIVLDVRMLRISGIELQRRLKAVHSAYPVIFMTGHGDVDLAVQAMKDGAIDFLQKPFREQYFLDTVERAVRLSLERHNAHLRSREAQQMLDQLSAREMEVARLLALGLSNKEVGRQLVISENTVHVHRQHIMEKTGAGGAADFARLILRANPGGLD